MRKVVLVLVLALDLSSMLDNYDNKTEARLWNARSLVVSSISSKHERLQITNKNMHKNFKTTIPMALYTTCWINT